MGSREGEGKDGIEVEEKRERGWECVREGM